MKKDTNRQKKLHFHNWYKSFVFAFNGLRLFFCTQPNSWIHCIATVFVITFGFLLNVSNFEWCLLIFAIGIVFAAELFNTAIEFLTDMISPRYDEKAGKVKDIAAAGVLIAAITSVIIGFIVFVPKILKTYLGS